MRSPPRAPPRTGREIIDRTSLATLELVTTPRRCSRRARRQHCHWTAAFRTSAELRAAPNPRRVSGDTVRLLIVQSHIHVSYRLVHGLVRVSAPAPASRRRLLEHAATTHQTTRWRSAPQEITTATAHARQMRPHAGRCDLTRRRCDLTRGRCRRPRAGWRRTVGWRV